MDLTLAEVVLCSVSAIAGIGTTGFSLVRSSAYKRGQLIADNAKNMWLTRIEEIEDDIKNRTEIARQDILRSLEDRQKQIESSHEDLQSIKARILKQREDLDLKKTQILALEKEIKKKKESLEVEIRAAAHQMSTSQISSIRKELGNLKKKLEDIQTVEAVDWKRVRKFERVWIPGREKLDILSIRDDIFSWMNPNEDYKIYIWIEGAGEIFVITSHDASVLERKIESILLEWKKMGNIFPAKQQNDKKRHEYDVEIFSRPKSQFLSPLEREESYRDWLMSFQKLEESLVEISQNIEEK